MIIVTDPKLLADEMLRIEGGCTVEVPPTTRAGRPVRVDYRPTVGVVFYVQELGIPQLMAAVGRELDARAPARSAGQIVAASPAALVRAPPAGGRRETVVRPTRRTCFIDPRPGDPPPPARLIMQTIAPELPRHCSVRADFTWVFTPVTAVADVHSFETMDEVNAVVASVVFDPDRALPLGAGAETLAPADLFPSHGLSMRLRNLGAFQVGVSGAGAAAKYALEIVGDHRRLRPGSDRAPALEFALSGDDDHACTECYAPLGGVAVMVLPGAATRRSGITYMCTHCWHAKKCFDAEYCHLTILPPQAVAAAAMAAASGAPDAVMLARLLAGAATPIAGAPGAYLVACEGGDVILAAEELGRHPELTVPAVRDLCKRVPVVMSYQRIAMATPD